MVFVRASLFAAALFAAIAVHAVPPGQASSTAEYVCAYRGIAAQHPDPKLRNPDYLADKLCSRSGNFGSDGKPDGRLLNWQRILRARVP